MKSAVSIVRCSSYEPVLVQEAVRKSLELFGGIACFVKPGSKVLVKPNLLLAAEPESGVDTHPEVVRALIRALRQINCTVYLGDGPSAFGEHYKDVSAVYERSGMQRIANEEGAALVKFDRRRMYKKFPLAACLAECDSLVSVPKFKTHQLMTLTGAIKNLYGLVTDTHKAELHSKYFYTADFARILVDVYQEARPALTVIDGIIAMEGDGPGTSGKLRSCGLLLAGADCVALDSVLSLIMGLKPADILTTREAALRGLGQAELSRIEILGEKLEDVTDRPFILPKATWTRKLPGPLVVILKKYKLFYPKVKHDVCIRCGDCIRICPRKVISMKKQRVTIDYAGCISCFCCQETCPASAIKVQKSLFARMIGI